MNTFSSAFLSHMLSVLFLQKVIEMKSQVPAGRLVSLASLYSLLQLIWRSLSVCRDKVKSGVFFKYKLFLKAVENTFL